MKYTMTTTFLHTSRHTTSMKRQAMPYDPLISRTPGTGLEHVSSYWAETGGPEPENDGRLETSVETDVAIIGGGYTGLSCAIHLARDFGINPVVLEANRPVWGCSGRNGSFTGPNIGRLSIAQWERRWGAEGARALWNESMAGLNTVRELIDRGAIDCDRQPDGRMKIAHSPKAVPYIHSEYQALKRLDYQADILSAEDIARDHCKGAEAFSAIRLPDGFCMHPMKFGYGLVRMARAAGAFIHASSPVLEWKKQGNEHCLSTPRGEVRARQVVFATNGYTNEQLHPCLKGGLLPVISYIVVTSPMDTEQQSECNFVTTDSLTDTKKFLNYFRRLPDNRIMLGSRGPFREGGSVQHSRWLLNNIKRKFPPLKNLGVEYYWGGWVAITCDNMPHVGCAEDDPTLLYSLGYCGSGVTAATQAGRRMAEHLGAGRPLMPELCTPLPRFPMARFRRLGQKIAFQWFRLQDLLP
ncbi:MAG: FAD-dependent oxidoreductase [Gammaproteobacteria bacterium]|nr:FAD-dependent oxidoreductase [Gammaproteobacteria bacterium]